MCVRVVVLEELQDGQHNVIDVAKARGFRLFGVMQATRPVDTNVGVAMVELHGAI